MSNLSENAQTHYKTMYDTIGKLMGVVMEAERTIQNLPRTEADVEALLMALAEADQDATAHFTRFKDESGKPWEEQSEECRKDWSRCCQQRDLAIGNLTRYAKAMRDNKVQKAA